MSNERSAERLFELLWGSAEPPRRGPKPSLTLDQIVATAVEIADAEGLAGLSMRKIAQRLGLTTMALYRYVPSKDDLVELMIDAIASPAPSPDDLPTAWREALRWLAHEQFAAIRRHPWVTEHHFSHPPLGPNNIAWMECFVHAILRAGLSAGNAIPVLSVITGYVMWESRQQQDLIAAASRTGISFEDVGIVYARMLESVAGDGRHPALAAVLASGGFGSEDDPGGPEDDFAYGLEFILDGIEAMVS